MKEEKGKGFRIPPNYFTDLKEILQRNAQKMEPFSVPENYFPELQYTLKNARQIQQKTRTKRIVLALLPLAACFIFGMIWLGNLGAETQEVPFQSKHVAIEVLDELYLEQSPPLLTAQEIAPSWVEEELASWEEQTKEQPEVSSTEASVQPAVEHIYELYLEEEATEIPSREELLEEVYFWLL